MGQANQDEEGAVAGDNESAPPCPFQRAICRPCFVGAESVGKSTLINSLIDPLGTYVCPTGDGMVTLHLTVVRHGDSDECYYGDSDECYYDDEMTSNVDTSSDATNEMEMHGRKMHDLKAVHEESLDTP